MTNNTNITLITDTGSDKPLFLIYYPFTVIVTGTFFNLLTFIILIRPYFWDTNKRPTIHYMRVIAIFDILMLYGWNFDHYLYYDYGFTLQTYTVPSCKIVSFIDYFSPQVSAWLRVFICIDRYLALSRLHKTWFSRERNVLIIIGSILIVAMIINFPFFPFACYYNADGSVNPDSHFYEVYPLWDYMNLALYNLVPFIFMSIFNSGVIYHLIEIRRKSKVENSRIRHRSISITLCITTCLFLIMTTPATISYAFFSSTGDPTILRVFDYVLYTYHITSFPLYVTTFVEFRQEVLRLVLFGRWRTPPSASSTMQLTTV